MGFIARDNQTHLGYIRTAYLGKPYDEWLISVFPEQEGPDFAVQSSTGSFISWRPARPTDFDKDGRLVIEDEDRRKVYRA